MKTDREERSHNLSAPLWVADDMTPMPGIWSRLLALEPHAKLNGFKLDYAASKQNGLDCWFIATLNGLRDKGVRLPKGFGIKQLRSRTRDWLVERADEYRLYGDDYWLFVSDCQGAWVTSLAALAALTVLSKMIGMNLEMVALCTTGSDIVEPLCSLSEYRETVRLAYAFDPEKHYVALREQQAAERPSAEQQARRCPACANASDLRATACASEMCARVQASVGRGAVPSTRGPLLLSQAVSTGNLAPRLASLLLASKRVDSRGPLPPPRRRPTHATPRTTIYPLQRLADTDWVENGQAMFRREIQSQHWGQLDPQSACDDA